MRSILLLVHRIPYPPNKGDKIRSYHLLRHLAARYRVHLGAFVDDPFDWQYEPQLRALCASVNLLPMKPVLRRLASARGLLTGEALSLPYYRSEAMQSWVDRTLREQAIDSAIAFSSTMAQYLGGDVHRGLRRIADFVDVDSDKFAQYAARARGPAAWLYRREASRLAVFERRIAAEFDATLFVTGAEASLFRRIAPQAAARTSHYDNGVDTAYFDPALPFDNPYADGGSVLVFTGAMDYWPNVEAVQWFADEVLPILRAQQPEIRFAIVGSNPADAVKALAQRPGVLVTGRVPDVRPYLAHAAVAVAPLRIARGIQNKVLEALAMARPLVCSGPAAEGIRPDPILETCVADTPAVFADKVLARIDAASRPQHRHFVMAHYSWESQLRKVDALLDANAAKRADEAGLGTATQSANSVADASDGTPTSRLIVFSSLFPSAAAPSAGGFIRERMFRVARHLPLAVVAPQPWSPADALIRRFRPGFRPVAARFEMMDGIEVHRPRFLSVPGVLKTLDGWLMARGSRPVMRLLAHRLNATVIDAHFGYPDGLAATLLGRELGLPVVISLRGSKDQKLLGTPREAGLRHALAGADRLIAVSESLVRDVGGVLGQPAERFTLIGNGVDTRRFVPRDRGASRRKLELPEDASVVVGVGNRIPLKGFQRVIPIIARLRQRFPNLIYLIVGGASAQGDMGPALSRQVADLGLQGAVRLCGRQDADMLSWYYSAADVFALATEYEGWANVFLEAMACGLPVVTTAVGGNPEVVCDTRLGSLVPWWDEAAFENALAAALTSAWDRSFIRAHAETNGWDSRVAQLITLFEEVSRIPANGSRGSAPA